MENKTVLIVDDHPFFRQSLGRVLKELSIDIIEAENGKQGYEIAKEKQPDLIVLDVAMPVLDGLNACKLIRADEKTSKIPILMFTANNSKKDVLAAISVGADDFAIKTAGMPAALEKVNKLLSR